MTTTAPPTHTITGAVAAHDDESFPFRAITGLEPDPNIELNEERLKRTIDRLVGVRVPGDGEQFRNWTVALRVLTGWLNGLSFGEVARVVGIPEDNLRRVLHGELALQASRRERVDRMVRVTRRLRLLLSDEFIGDWFRTPVPALGNDTPLEALRKRKVGHVERLVDSYFDSSYA